jgi:hypothetical protein
VARSLHQLGMLFEVEEAYTQAVHYVAQAFVILDQLGSPDREIARKTLARLRQKMGEEAFDTAWAAANLPQESDDVEQG